VCGLSNLAQTRYQTNREPAIQSPSHQGILGCQRAPRGQSVDPRGERSPSLHHGRRAGEARGAAGRGRTATARRTKTYCQTPHEVQRRNCGQRRRAWEDEAAALQQRAKQGERQEEGGTGGRLSSAETADGGQAARLKQGARWAATAAAPGRGAGRRGVACVSRRQGGRQQHGASMRARFRPRCDPSFAILATATPRGPRNSCGAPPTDKTLHEDEKSF